MTTYGTIVAFAIALIIMGAVMACNGSFSTVGGTRVPNTLDCAEDEVIHFTGEAADELGCIHIGLLELER